MAVLLKYVAVVLVCTVVTETMGFDYCTIESCTEVHTMCKYPDKTVACSADGVVTGLTKKLRKAILKRHNQHRQAVALGKQSPQPEASNMKKLSWHKEAAKIAQRWANQCDFNHDSCRNVEDFTVGQNIALHSFNLSSPNMKETIEKMIDSWYAEVEDFDENNVSKFESSSGGKAVGHYTQMVWAETTGVGCGLIQMPPDSDSGEESGTVHLICNYVPAGNVIDQPMYEEGTACSGCSKCSEAYTGLCL